MKLPQELVHKVPSDGMCGKTDEDNLGFTYESLDLYIRGKLPFKSLEVQNKVIQMHNNINTFYKLHPMAGIEKFEEIPKFEQLSII